MELDSKQLANLFGELYTDCTALTDEMLARYLELERAGRNPDRELPEVGAHLQACPECAELVAVLRAAAEKEDSTMASSTPFDLSFLPSSKPDLWDEVQEGLRRLAAEVPILVQRTRTAFGSLAAPLTPYRVAAHARGAPETARVTPDVESLEIPDNAANLLFVLTPGAVGEQGERMALILQVRALDSGDPLGQVRINLHSARGQLVQSKRTEADGRVILNGLSGEYLLRCRHAGHTWELPLKLEFA